MKRNKMLDALCQFTVARFRSINVKLWGNHRWGYYREYSPQDIITLINEFHTTTQQADSEQVAPDTKLHFKAGSNFAILSRLCEQYYVYEGSDKLQKRVIEEVAQIIDELRNDQETQAQLEAMLDAQQDNIMQRFRAQHPQLKEKDFRLYSYLTAGFSATTIAVLLGQEKSVVYNRISRLKKIING
ncbi:MAG: hypothetical protein J6J06_03295 [Bacteroidaceae bacterium]|nr:hypothetical protein [Bacteroidaceae bacterium]